MSFRYLSDERVSALYQAAIHHHLAGKQDALLEGIDPGFVAGLPEETANDARLSTTLNRLNERERLADESVPFVTWLQNALRFAKDEVFRAALEEVQKRAGPEEAPQDLWEKRGLDQWRGVDDRFLERVERVAKLRQPEATFVRHKAPPPFAGFLEVSRCEGALVTIELLGAIEQPITEALVDQFVTDVERPYREQDPMLRSTLIYTGQQASLDLLKQAKRRGVTLKSFGEHQGLMDFTGYLRFQTKRLEQDQVYPPWLYVEQPATMSFANDPVGQKVESALQSLWELLDSPHPRFVLVLGDFGAGKTFLLHELARRMDVQKHPLIPVLVEMRKLEKQRSIRQLVAQHFAAADVGRIDLDAFEYLLAEGKVALLFDGFDELAQRVSYETAMEHLDTVMEAARGNAKVVLTSRRQYFLTDHQVKRELALRAEKVPGYRLYALEAFGPPQIKSFLNNLLKGDTAEADARYGLIRDVHDLMGLSKNPRMLGFIAELDKAKLEEVKQREGKISAAELYKLLVDQWLQFEYDRANPKGSPPGISKEALRQGMTELGLSIWHRGVKTFPIEELPESLFKAVQSPNVTRAVASHLIGSGSLLVRDADGRFSFMHRSVMEWLVAEAAAKQLQKSEEPSALTDDEMSPLMTNFWVDMAGLDNAAEWARDRAHGVGREVERRNAAKVLKVVEPIYEKMGISTDVPVTLDYEGLDLSGEDLSGMDLREANFTDANLLGATLVGAKLVRARLVGANLRHADLRRADLQRADMQRADLSYANLMDGDLRGANLQATQLSFAKLWTAKLDKDSFDEPQNDFSGAALPGQSLKPMIAPQDPLFLPRVAYSKRVMLATAGYESGTICLWDTESGVFVRALQGHSRSVWGLAFSPDNLTLASGSSDGTIGIWDLSSGALRSVLKGHSQVVWSVAFSPDNLTLASGSDDTTIRLWDLPSGKQRSVLQGHSLRVWSVAFSPDNLTLASGSDDTTIRLWDVPSGKERVVLQGHSLRVLSVAFSPDNLALASGSFDATIRLWDSLSGELISVLKGHSRSVFGVAFSPDGITFASGSDDTTIRLWDLPSGQLRSVLQGHSLRVSSVAFSPDNLTLASSSSDNTIRLWDVPSGKCFAILMPMPEGWVAFAPDGRYKLHGDIQGAFWHVVGLCRFEPGELPHLRLDDDVSFRDLIER